MTSQVSAIPMLLILIAALSCRPVDAAIINWRAFHAANASILHEESATHIDAKAANAQILETTKASDPQEKKKDSPSPLLLAPELLLAPAPDSPEYVDLTPPMIGLAQGAAMGIPTIFLPPDAQDALSHPTRQQKAMWLGTIVYAGFGILVGYLYYKARLEYTKVFLPQAEPGVLPRLNSFSFDLCSCFSDPKMCVMGFCCPCLRWADTLDKHGVLPYWTAFIVMFFLGLLSIYTSGFSLMAMVLLGAYYRQKLRAHFEIEYHSLRSVFSDCMLWLFCQPCAIVQEAREEAVQRGTAIINV